ncbi:unnamed protein product [Auanema sp. JU1783]|nr:unnamed protein product [Auanema sp. JU1783]
MSDPDKKCKKGLPKASQSAPDFKVTSSEETVSDVVEEVEDKNQNKERKNSLNNDTQPKPKERRLTPTISIESVSTFLKNSILPTEKSAEQKKEEKMIVRPGICRLPLHEIPEFCLSLSGCGFLGSYHFGVVNCFLRNGKPVMSKLKRVSGVSAGSLVAALLVLNPEKLPRALDMLYTMADELNSLKFGALTPGYYLNEKLIKVVEDYLPEDISAAENKLYVSLTAQDSRDNVLVKSFPTREHLIKCLLASCYIPIYSMGYAGQPPVIEDVAYIDGGYTNNLPDFKDIRTITVSPFSGNADISPSDSSILFDWQMTLGTHTMKVNLQNIVRGAQALFPPKRSVLESYYEAGYKDAFKFLLEHHLIQRQAGTAV